MVTLLDLEFPMNRSLPPILESAEELKTLLSKSLSKRVSERVHALYLIQSSQVRTRQEISSLLGRHRRTVGNWLALYEQEGLSGLLTLRTRPNNPLSLDDQELGQLRERLSHPAGFGSYLEVRDWIAERFRKSLGYSTVHQLVRYRLRSKLKVPRKIHERKDEVLSLQFKKNSPTFWESTLGNGAARRGSASSFRMRAVSGFTVWSAAGLQPGE